MLPRSLLALLLLLCAACQSAPPVETSPNERKPDRVYYEDYCQLCGATWDSHEIRCQNPNCLVENGALNGGPCPRCGEPWPPGMKYGPCPVCDGWYEVGPVIPGFGYSGEVEARYRGGNVADPPN